MKIRNIIITLVSAIALLISASTNRKENYYPSGTKC